MKTILYRTGAVSFAVALLVALLVMPQFLQAQTVEAVPYSPTSTTTPHPTYSVCSDGATPPDYTPPQYSPSGNPPPTGAVASCASGTLQEVNITVQAVLLNPVSGHTYTYQWSYGDGSPLSTATTVTNAYDLSLQHQYPVATGANTVGKNYTATVTVNDTTGGTPGTPLASGPAEFLVQQQGNTLQVRVNLAIDDGLWYMHQTEWRSTSGTTLGSSGSIPIGGWDSNSGYISCPSTNGADYDGCQGYAEQTAANVQAFEVSGRLPSPTGPSTDPYTDDVNRGLNRIFQFLSPSYTGGGSYTDSFVYNPATANFGCSDGMAPTFTNSGGSQGYCNAGATEVFYNPGATSCTMGTPSTPCTFTFDGNNNLQLLLVNGDGDGEPNYQGGAIIDAIVASGLPSATAATGVGSGGSGSYPGVLGESYANIVQDLVEGYEYGQWGSGPQYDVEGGSYPRGYPQYGGGAWLYGPQQGDDNSVSQWAAIGLISAVRGFGAPAIPKITTDTNNYWITFSQDVQDSKPTGADPITSTDNYGAFGYRGSDYYSNAWGIFADTPSGLVQMSLDGIGRTTNTTFGDATTAADQRFNNAESLYADNFCNDPSQPYGAGSTNNALYAPRAYAYGMFSFTKAMLLHDPAGVLSPIVYLRTLTPGVFPNIPGQPANSIDWYAALSSENGGTDACNGVAETILARQGHDNYQYDYPYPYDPGYNQGKTNQSDPANGFWYGNTYDTTQFPFETAWSIIMLRQSVFVSCVANLYGQALAGRGASSPTVTLTWAVQANATSYAVYRSSTKAGTPSQVGTSSVTNFVDKTSGLVNTDTYYYTVQPLNSNSASICSSNQEAVTIP